MPLATIILTAVVCASPIPVGASVQEIDAAKCDFVEKAYTSSHKQCRAVRNAYMADIGRINFHGYFMCTAEGDDFDPDATFIAVPRQRFDSKKGV